MTRSTSLRIIALSLLLILAAGAGVLLLDRHWPPPLEGLNYSAQILDHEGQLLRLYTTPEGYWRLPPDLEQLDKLWLERLLLTEDRRFYQHHGVDPLALLRAFQQLLQHGRVVSGGSTVTLQTIRLLEPRPRRLDSKLVEFFRAWQLEQRLSKTEILELYLTLAPYGGNLQGVRAASRFYFDKEPTYLTPAEQALLIALPQAPEARRPDRHAEAARQARDRLLWRWYHAGLLDAWTRDTALASAIPTQRQSTPTLAPHLGDHLRRQAPEQTLFHTSLDYTLQHRLQLHLARAQSELAEGQTLAALVVEHTTGAVRAWVGSGDYWATHFPGQVDMVTAPRSPGSLLKPFIYGLGFRQHLIHPHTRILDQPDPTSAYQPRNFDHRYQGEMRIAEALQLSRNVPAVQILAQIGVDALLDALEHAEIRLFLPNAQAHDPGLAIGLGGLGLTMLDLVTLYTALGQAGDIQHPRVLINPAETSPLTNGRREWMDAVSAWYVTRILLDTPRPSGRWRDNHPIAIKTGTSFGYRDAWALGVDAHYTIAVWAGRPDGGFTPDFTGMQVAVPLLLDSFAFLPRTAPGTLTTRTWPGPPPDGAYTGPATELPEDLRWFTTTSPFPARQEHPRFIYPRQDTTLLWHPEQPPLQIQVRHNTDTLHWLINGRPASLQTLSRQRYAWQPPDYGVYRLTVLDEQGRSDSVEIILERHHTISLTPDP